MHCSQNTPGEALSAITLIRSIGEFLSPVILGTLMNSTIDTRLPQAVFFVASVSQFSSVLMAQVLTPWSMLQILIALGAGIVTLIRDSDRYIPHIDRPQHDGNVQSGELRSE
jgi:hypothetical protein